MIHCIRCRITGRVQGVWFRASTRQRAEQHRINGAVRNLPDGSVEVVACGEEVDLTVLREWLWHGPAGAQVDNVQCESVPTETLSGFSVG
jgi:acylphosphatase